MIYDDFVAGHYYADIIVENKIILELKTVNAFDECHVSQLLHYLHGTDSDRGLLINFATPKLQIKRVVNHYSDLQP